MASSESRDTSAGAGRREESEPNGPIEWRLIEAPKEAEISVFLRFSYNVGTIAGMAGKLPSHVAGLFKYLSAPHEKANEDLAIGFFRHEFGEKFTRQKEAKFSDGYVSGHFLVELKGARSDWFRGLLQGLLYHRELDFGSVVVAAKGFLGIWSIESLPGGVMTELGAAKGAASAEAVRFAREWKHRQDDFLRCAMYLMKPEMLVDGGLFHRPDILADAIKEFLATLRAGKRVRLKLTPKNFTNVLRGMAPFFSESLKSVRAFYSMIYAWEVGSRVVLSERNDEHALITGGAIAGETVQHLRPEKRDAFKEYVERYAVHLEEGETPDAFFARYDEALDAVDPDFRRKHGIFFTDMNLSRFVMWLARRDLGDIGKNHLVIDPACGSGNLVTNWRSPMELRHKVVSEIEPELLFAVERRMKGDAWHNGRFTVVPSVREGRGLNFLEVDAKTYLKTIRRYLQQKGLDANRPIAFLCNPPFRNNDDRTHASEIDYAVDPSIVEAIGSDAAGERYCCFLAQMKLVCDAAEDSGLPGDSLLLVFSKLGWLTDREVLSQAKRRLMGNFDPAGGIIFNSKQFFDVAGEYPVAFTMWRYRAAGGADATQPVPLTDLTWMANATLSSLQWGDAVATDAACAAIMGDERSIVVQYGAPRMSVFQWSESSSTDFKRGRRRSEPMGSPNGLPQGAPQLGNKKAYGETDGQAVGFMDDLTLCRVRREPIAAPWFRLDKPFMDCRKGRCLSGPPDQKGHVADSRAKANRLFFWYAVQKTFCVHRYPMWADPLDLWGPVIPDARAIGVNRLARAIAFADNECVCTRFPANNPAAGLPELTVSNPMSPNDQDGWWVKQSAHMFDLTDGSVASRIVLAVNELYRRWATLFRMRAELPLDISRNYYAGRTGFVTAASGILQIRDWIERKDDLTLRAAYVSVQETLKEGKIEFYRLLSTRDGLDYFGAGFVAAAQPGPPPGGPVIAKTAPTVQKIRITK